MQDVDAGEVLQFRGCIGCRVPKLVKVQLPTLFVNKGRPGLPLVLFHGLGLGLGFFVPLIKAVSYPGPVISVDLPGSVQPCVAVLLFPKHCPIYSQVLVEVQDFNSRKMQKMRKPRTLKFWNPGDLRWVWRNLLWLV